LYPISKRQRVADVLHQSGVLRAILAMRARGSMPCLNVLTYHRVADGDREEPFDDGVVDTTEEAFDRQLRCFKRYFNIVGLEELSAWSAGKKLPPNPLAITFDDGYLDCYTRALPLLRHHQARAIFFVPTTVISERRVYWWDRLSYIVKHAHEEKLSLEYPFRVEIALGSDRASAIHFLICLVKDRPLDVSRFLDELGAAAGVPWTAAMEREFADRLLMSWNQVRALSRAGMGVQSHTRTHRVLQSLSPEDLKDELDGSRADLERELGEPVRALAYPVGRPLVGSSPIRSALERAGYKLGFSNGTGSTPLWGRRDCFDIRRQTIDRDLPEPYLLGLLAVPSLAPRCRWLSISR
jgi:peptidoglycan/xylan/chitin deacetylase (PgdA/CDA1 family)